MFGFIGWSQIEPLVYSLAPTFRAVKQGPPDMPMSITIELTGLRITNESSEPRSCEAEIGQVKVFRAKPFMLGPRGVRVLFYTSFADDDAVLTDAAGYVRARQNITIECMDTRGVSRRVGF